MKKTLKQILLIIVVLILPNLVICQNSSQTTSETNAPPYKMMHLKFELEGSPSPQDVGFDNTKSFWQFRYELRFLSKEFEFQYFREQEGESQKKRTKLIRKNNKAYDKGWKKNGSLVVKGKTQKLPLSSASNREIIIPVNLTSEITDILAKAENTWQNPQFRITLRGKISTQTNSNLKFKSKLNQSFVCPTKIQTKEAQYWMTNTCGISYEILKKEDGRIILGLRSRI